MLCIILAYSDRELCQCCLMVQYNKLYLCTLYFKSVLWLQVKLQVPVILVCDKSPISYLFRTDCFLFAVFSLLTCSWLNNHSLCVIGSTINEQGQRQYYFSY